MSPHLLARRRSQVLGALLVVLIAAPAPAHATPNFPGAIARKLGASSSPECAVCHQDGRVGRGTVTTGFGSSMRARGLVAYDERSLESALDQMAADRVDSDGDGSLDVAALRLGENPNGAGGVGTGDPEPTTPTYGCVGRVSPSRQPDATLVGLFLALALGMLLLRRRRLRTLHVGTGALVVGLVLGGSAACSAGGEALSPRSAATRPTLPPRMQPLAPTAFADDLRGLGLDPLALPRFEKLTPLQVRRVMGMFTRSLGLACTDCHDATDARAPTRRKRMAVRMWNELMREHSSVLGPVFCDSCHGGQAKFLVRGDHELSAVYMSDNYTDKLKRRDGKAVECETCHGDPADPHFLAKW